MSDRIRTEEGEKEDIRRAWTASLDPEMLAGIDSLELRARAAVEGFVSGIHPSPFHGISHEFVEHREYTPGDDPGQIDWKAFARQERLFVKRYQAVTNAPCQIVIDGSLSMEYGRTEGGKLEYAKTLAAALAYLLFEQKDRIGLSIGGGETLVIRPSRRFSYRETIRRIAGFRPGPGPHLEHLLHLTAAALERKGLVMIISGFLKPGDLPSASLQRLRYRGHEVIAFQVLHRTEVDLDLPGRYRFRDPEDGREVAAWAPAVREEYRRRLNRWLAEVEEHFFRNQVMLHRMTTADPLVSSLALFLNRRARSL